MSVSFREGISLLCLGIGHVFVRKVALITCPPVVVARVVQAIGSVSLLWVIRKVSVTVEQSKNPGCAFDRSQFQQVFFGAPLTQLGWRWRQRRGNLCKDGRAGGWVREVQRGRGNTKGSTWLRGVTSVAILAHVLPVYNSAEDMPHHRVR